MINFSFGFFWMYFRELLGFRLLLHRIKTVTLRFSPGSPKTTLALYTQNCILNTAQLLQDFVVLVAGYSSEVLPHKCNASFLG